MKSIKKRFAKAKIVSTVIQYGEDGDSTFTDEEPLFDDDAPKSEITENFVGESETSTLTTDCTIADKGTRIEISYDESEITGMAGSTTRLVFDKENPELVSLMRDGTVTTALVFERGRRHLCVYQTPYFPIELCVNTLELKNDISYNGGTFTAEYLVEMNGVMAEKTRIVLSIIG